MGFNKPFQAIHYLTQTKDTLLNRQPWHCTCSHNRYFAGTNTSLRHCKECQHKLCTQKCVVGCGRKIRGIGRGKPIQYYFNLHIIVLARKGFETLEWPAGLCYAVQLIHIPNWDFCIVMAGKWRPGIFQNFPPGHRINYNNDYNNNNNNNNNNAILDISWHCLQGRYEVALSSDILRVHLVALCWS